MSVCVSVCVCVCVCVCFFFDPPQQHSHVSAGELAACSLPAIYPVHFDVRDRAMDLPTTAPTGQFGMIEKSYHRWLFVMKTIKSI